MVLTRIFGVLGADIIVASVKNIFVHEGRARSHLPEERNLDRFANLYSLTLLHEDLTSEFAPILAIKRRNTVLLGMVTLLEWLQGCHEVVSSSNTMRDDALGNASSDGTFDDCCHRVHRTHNLGLELGRHMELDLLEEIFRCTKTADDQHVL